METKLTLRMDKDILEKAKQYAHIHNISLSKMIEKYLDSVTAPKGDTGITPLVESLSGVISVPEDYDLKKEYTGYLSEKYK